MVIKNLSHIYKQYLYGSCTVVVQCLTVQLLYKCRTDSVQKLERGKRYMGGMNELTLRGIGGKVE